MGRTAGALGLAPNMATEGPAAEEGLAVAMSAAGDLAATEEGSEAVEEGPTVEGDGPWRTHGL